MVTGEKNYIDNVILGLLEKEPASTLYIVRCVKKDYPSLPDSFITARVFALVDTGFIEMTPDRKMRVTY